MTKIFAVDELMDVPVQGSRGTLLTALADLDLATSDAARAELAHFRARADKALVLDVTAVFVSVIALRLIVEVLEQAVRHGIAFAVVGAPHWVIKIMPHLDIPLLPLYDTVTAAVAGLRGAAGLDNAACGVDDAHLPTAAVTPIRQAGPRGIELFGARGPERNRQASRRSGSTHWNESTA
jgi:anti-anti-sigma regulatory factor